MNIHEYQAKAVLRTFGVAVPAGVLATEVSEAVDACGKLGGGIWVVKAQIHAGGRGKAGGVRICRSPDEVRAAAESLLGQTLVTRQTGPAGKVVHKLYIEEGLGITSEFYLSLLVDREAEAVSFVVSPAGGVDIEEVAASTPEKICTRPVALDGVTEADSVVMADALGLPSGMRNDFHRLVNALLHTFTERDCSLLELNPLVMTAAQELVALDAKMVIDDNALYRQPDMRALRDTDEEDVREAEAARFGLNYIQLDGDIGCMVNGAGLAMATMDIIQLKGERPANFLDVGGGVTGEAVAEAFRLLFSDAHVQAVLVNIFGGIVRCDIIANGLLQAVKTHPMRVPVVMRLVGTREEEGRRLIRDAGLEVQWAADLDEAAEYAVAVARGATA